MEKPLGKKNYGSIPHLSGSRLGLKDYHIGLGQELIATVKARDKHDKIIVQEKLDGANVGIYKKADNELYALTRSGYNCNQSPYSTHKAFATYLRFNLEKYNQILKDGERICGEWLWEAVGTKYKLPHKSYFVPFDIMTGNERLPYHLFFERMMLAEIPIPRLLHIGEPISVANALFNLGDFGYHGALEPAEGLVYRVERKEKVDFLAKFVRHGKVDGKYLNQNIINEIQD